MFRLMEKNIKDPSLEAIGLVDFSEYLDLLVQVVTMLIAKVFIFLLRFVTEMQHTCTLVTAIPRFAMNHNTPPL
jgi:hypothetical protein